MASESHKTVYLAPAANAGIGVGSGVLDLRGRERIVDGGKEEGGVGIVFAVLAVALVLEGSALVRAARRTHGQAKAKRRSFARHIRASRDPTTKTVVFEDGAAGAGIVLAVLGLGPAKLTDNAVYDGAAS
jgi:hypothetical protein